MHKMLDLVKQGGLKFNTIVVIFIILTYCACASIICQFRMILAHLFTAVC
jgi:hypothetical protein